MRKLAVSMMLGLALGGFGASEAKAACIDFDNFCDCMTVNGATETIDGQTVTLLFGCWQNQDCAGTTSPMSGMFKPSVGVLAGEVNSSLGLDGINWNFAFVTALGSRVFNLDMVECGSRLRVQNESPWTLVAGNCPSDCSGSGDKAGLPASSSR